MIHQTLFSSKDESKKIKCRPVQFCLALLKGLIKMKSFSIYNFFLFIANKEEMNKTLGSK